MLLPDSFEREISSRFYDKEITVLEPQETIESDGGVIREDYATKTTFFGNVRFNTLGLVQGEIGLTLDADIVITCDKSTDIALNDILEYLDKRYSVTDLLPSDSHLTITGKECQLKS